MKSILLIIFSFYTFFSFSQLELSNATVFEVDEVETATILLPTEPVDSCLSKKIGRDIVYISEDVKGKDCVRIGIQNSFIGALHASYAEHRPFVLTPESFWLCVLQGVNHKRSSTTDDAPNKKDMLVRYDDVALDDDASWSPVLKGFETSLKKELTSTELDFYIPQFSNTSADEHNVFVITQMEGVSHVYNYQLISGCGIPRIYLRGSLEDWYWIQKNLDKLKEYGLQEWAEVLKPIVKEVIAAKNGNARREFWREMYKTEEVYTNLYISGWVLKLFPFIEKSIYRRNGDDSRVIDTLVENPYMKNRDYLGSNLTIDDIPMGSSTVEIEWEDRFNNKKSIKKIIGGFLLVYQHHNMALEPVITWCVTGNDRFERRNLHYLIDSWDHEYKNKEYWSHQIYRKPITKATVIYSEISKEEEGLPNEVLLKQRIEKRALKNGIDLKGVKVALIVLSNGTLYKVTFDGKKLAKKGEVLLTNYIMDEFSDWTPATSNQFPRGTWRGMHGRDAGEVEPFRVNSRVDLEF